jgi:putative tricarboxylic transport membrane protein
MAPNIKHERIAATLLLVFSVLYTCGSLRLKLGQISNPGSGFVPLIVGLLLIGLTGAYVTRAFTMRDKGEKREDDTSRSWSGHGVTLCIAALVIVYPFLLRYLDFLISTFVTVWLILILLKYKRIYISGAIAIVITVALFMLFSRALNVVLPSGEIEQFLLNL